MNDADVKVVTGESPTDREKWDAEKSFKERELSIKENELDIKKQEQAAAGWKNPLIVAIMAAAVAAFGNAAVTMTNGIQQRALEDQKSEQARILEMIKTGDPDKAAENLKFLLDAGLITKPEIVQKLNIFLSKRKPGSGPTLPSSLPASMPQPYKNTGVASPQLSQNDVNQLMAEVVKVASTQLGVTEIPPSSNKGPEVEIYLRSVGLPPGMPWNVAFVYWCYMQASEKIGIKNPLPKTAGTIDMWMKSEKLSLTNATELAKNNKKIEPGSIFAINRGQSKGHVGIIESISDGMLNTIEGNINISPSRDGGGVYRKQRKLTEISGLISIEPEKKGEDTQQ